MERGDKHTCHGFETSRCICSSSFTDRIIFKLVRSVGVASYVRLQRKRTSIPAKDAIVINKIKKNVGLHSIAFFAIRLTCCVGSISGNVSKYRLR